MPQLKSEYNDREILERVAEAEIDERPFEYEVSGVEAEDIGEYFDHSDFDSHPMIMVPNRLHWLSEAGYLEKVYSNRSSANATYRLTNQGWSIVDTVKPT